MRLHVHLLLHGQLAVVPAGRAQGRARYRVKVHEGSPPGPTLSKGRTLQYSPVGGLVQGTALPPWYLSRRPQRRLLYIC